MLADVREWRGDGDGKTFHFNNSVICSFVVQQPMVSWVSLSLFPSVSRRTALCVSVLTTTRAWWPPTARCVTGDAVATSDRNVAAASPSPSTPQVQLHGTS